MKTTATLAILALFASMVAEASAQGRGKRPPQGQGASEGQKAPNFKLKTQDGRATVELQKLKGKPTVLIFGSYT